MKKMKFLILVLVVFFASQVLNSYAPCVFNENTNGVYTIVNPENCATFFMIMPPDGKVLIYCPRGLYFCSQLGMCSYFDDHNCLWWDCKMLMDPWAGCDDDYGRCYEPYYVYIPGYGYARRCNFTGYPSDNC